MNISLYDNNAKLAYNPNTEKNYGVGGTQTIIINVARHLAKLGHAVKVYIKCNAPNLYAGVFYYQYRDYVPEEEDLLIGFESLPRAINAKKVFMWSTRIAPADVIKHPNVDKVIVCSDWHRDKYATILPVDLKKKLCVIEPGVDGGFLVPKEKWEKSITYAGHPFKGGMAILSDYNERLKESHSDANVYAYGGGQLWGWDNEQYRPLYNKLVARRIKYSGMGGKVRLQKQLGGSQIFLYPVGRHYEEVFSLVILEAMASGCVVIASNNGNIKNQIKDVGFCIKGDLNDYKWQVLAVEATCKLLDNPATLKTYGEMSREVARQYTWEKTVSKLLKLL